MQVQVVTSMIGMLLSRPVQSWIEAGLLVSAYRVVVAMRPLQYMWITRVRWQHMLGVDVIKSI
jgi:hypothetical protein